MSNNVWMSWGVEWGTDATLHNVKVFIRFLFWLGWGKKGPNLSVFSSI